MKARYVLFGCALVGALVVPTGVMAQTLDTFAGGFNAAIPWVWDIPGNTPTNTQDPTHYTFASNALQITAQSGSLYAGNNNAHNIPNLLILDQPDYWYIETAVSTDWTMASPSSYVHAGLVFLTDADDYFSFYNNLDAANAPMVQVSSTFELGGVPGYGGVSSTDWNPTTDYVRLRVEGTPTEVNFLFEQGGNWQLAGTASAASNPDVYTFLTSVVGLRVGLETDTGGGSNSSPFSFGYFKTNLTVAQTEDDFAGGFNPSIPWTWNVPGNAPADTDDPMHYAFSPNSLDVTVQSGSLYANNNSAHNIPSLLIADQPPYWYVETAVRNDWSMASLSGAYIHAGLIFFFDADNYFSFYNDLNAPNSSTAPSVQVSTTWETGGSAQYGGISSTDWAPTTDYVKLRVQGTPTAITFLFDHTGTWQKAGTLTSTNQPDVFALMSSLVGMQVGLEVDSGGGTDTSPFSFGYFKTNLSVGPYGP
jgi:hypothetical protein